MSDKTFKIVGNDISDGYHTFDELYDHRCLLYIAMALLLKQKGDGLCFVKEHFAGWDLLVLEPEGKPQISYHIPLKYAALYRDIVPEVAIKDHKYDGHTSKDVLERLIYIIAG